MPTNATDTPSWVANVQRPNNGELADAASLAQGFNPLTQRSRWTYERVRDLVFDVTRAPFNSPITTAANAAVAIQAALNAASVRGGRVVLPGGSYRLDSGLTFYPGVELVGDPDRTNIYLNHASADLLTLNSPGNRVAAVIRGINFEGWIANTGKAINVGAAASGRLLLQNCSFNSSSNLQTRLVQVDGPVRVDLQDCDLLSGSSVGVLTSHGSAFLGMSGGRLRMPASYSSDLVSILGGSASFRGVDFDLTDHTIGTANALSLGVFAGQHISVVGNTFRGNTVTTHRAISSDSGVLLVSRGNSYKEVTRFSTGLLARGSDLDLEASTFIDVGSAPSFTLPQGYRAIVVKGTASPGPAITLPAGMFYGQELQFTYYNAGTPVTPSFASTPVTATAVPLVGAGNTLTSIFVFEEKDSGSGRWIQKGTWGVGLTLV